MTKPRAKEAQIKIAFQGEAGANSHLACREIFPAHQPLAQTTFEDVFQAVSDGRAKYGLIPIENSVAGRIADPHHLMPESGLYIVGEHFQPVHHQLLVVPGTKLSDLKSVMSQAPALGQCRKFIRAQKLEAISGPDTAGSARIIAERGDKSCAAIASRLAAEIYGLSILKEDIEDAQHNTTRFLIMAKEPAEIAAGSGPTVTSFVFRVRNVPAALYKAMGGFATRECSVDHKERE